VEDLKLAMKVHANVSPSGAAEDHENVCLGAMLKQAGMLQACASEQKNVQQGLALYRKRMHHAHASIAA
jgi:hypothetical protein